MGEIRANFYLQNLSDLALSEAGYIPENQVRHIELDAFIDTGAVMMLLPRDVVEKLGLKLFDKRIVTLANEEKTELDVAGGFMLHVCGRRFLTDCLVGPPLCEPIVGQLVLEALDLVLNPAKKTITVNPESPHLPHLKMK